LQQTLATGLTLSLVGGGFALGRDRRDEVSGGSGQPDRNRRPGPPTAPHRRTGTGVVRTSAAEASPAVVRQGDVDREGRRGRCAFGPARLAATRKPFRGFSAPRRGGSRSAARSGFIIRKDGVVLTNNHVVENAKQSRSR
jgi:S1-C subfamily serine protease